MVVGLGAIPFMAASQISDGRARLTVSAEVLKIWLTVSAEVSRGLLYLQRSRSVKRVIDHLVETGWKHVLPGKLSPHS